MVEVECIGFEILTVLAGLIGTAELYAQTLLVTLCGFMFKIPFLMGIAAGTRIADLLGSGSLTEAKETARLSLFLAGGIGLFIAVLNLSFRKQIPYIFTNEEGVASLMLKTIPLLVVFTLIDVVVDILTRIIRGMGK